MTNIKKALQNLSRTSVACIVPNHNQNNIEPNSESSNQEPETSKKPKTIPGVWKNFQSIQISLFCKKSSPTFSTLSIPKSAWTMPTSELLMNKELLSDTIPITKYIIVLQYLQGVFLAGNLEAADHYSSKDMHADLEDLARNSELLFKEILIAKTIKRWIERYNASFKKEALK
ncbi:2499_t:CDS:2 [Cetraspora pellucida]|uniref:2499_t:CDS:1 n=1 Tax=Cetraspora pellucida TaxID=1433469 RepID=A0A9N9P669_9GLOM|nr:2499_t:CDS:2 [Cetraspora pellucida]